MELAREGHGLPHGDLLPSARPEVPAPGATGIASGRPGDLALVMLAGGGTERVLEIAKRAFGLEGAERQRVLYQLVQLSGLRRLMGRLTMELKTMGITTDSFYKNEFVMDAMRHAEAGMLRGQLETKFGSLPKWVDERLDGAASAQLGRWSKKILSAGTLEGVFGRQQPHMK